MSSAAVTAPGGSPDPGAAFGRLARLSREQRQNAFTGFEWPDELPPDAYWMSKSLLTVAGAEAGRDLPDDRLRALSRYESVHFYSLNIHGIRELLTAAVDRIHTPEFREASQFLHHFIDEENQHMWFFAEFCTRYGGKIYPERRLRFGEPERGAAGHFLTFARIQLFEEIVDYFNVRMGEDTSLPPIVRAINAAHHREEARHIAFGREMVRRLHRRLAAEAAPSELARVEQYLHDYLTSCVLSLYNPSVYRDAGLAERPQAFRRGLIDDPARREAHREIVKSPLRFAESAGIFTRPWAPP